MNISELGNSTIMINATDGFASISTSFRLTVRTYQPRLTAPIQAQLASLGRQFAFNCSITFYNIQIFSMTYTATLDNGDPLPLWLLFDGNQCAFSGTPTSLEQMDTLNISLTAVDAYPNASYKKC